MENYPEGREHLISVLQNIQDKYNYIPPEMLPEVATNLNIPLSSVYSVVTFYKSFNLTPKGKYLITACMGTACHVRGASQIVSEIKRVLKIDSGDTTNDGLFTLRTVNCLGVCALAPVVVINDKYYGSMNIRKVEKLLESYRNPQASSKSIESLHEGTSSEDSN